MSLETYYNTLKESLEKGYPVMVMVAANTSAYSKALHYSTNGHYMVITGVYKDANGVLRVKINDPYSAAAKNAKNRPAPQQLDMPLETLKGMSERHSGSIILPKKSAGARQ